MSLSPELQKIQGDIERLAKDYGLDFFTVMFEELDWKQMNMVAAYGGFPNRYPHWRFGMEYERLSKSYAYGLSKIYEMVINNDPCYAYLLYSNKMVDQKMVMAHVYAHCDFFKNNVYFSNTNRKMMDEMANHRTRVLKYIDRFGVDVVETFVDACLSIENLIDLQLLTLDRFKQQAPLLEVEPARFQAKPYMEKFINPPKLVEEERRRMEEHRLKGVRSPERPQKDVLGFLMKQAPLEDWEYDILEIVREEAYYFAPQGQTKVLNEGWACVVGDTLIVTDRGFIPMKELVERRLPLCVHDGKRMQPARDYACFNNRQTVRIKTRRGLELEGSKTHQILLADGKTWKRLDSVKKGDKISIGGATNLWAENYVVIDWEIQRRKILEDVAEKAGVSLSTVIRHRAGTCVSRSALALEEALKDYDTDYEMLSYMQNKRKEIHIPPIVDERLASFLGYLIGDGNISEVNRTMGFTTGDETQATRFAFLVRELFDLTPRIKIDGNRFRVLTSSQTLHDFLKVLGLTVGPSARQKRVPSAILRSPKSVMASFLRALFDCDGYAGPHGVILSTSSTKMAKTVQAVLLNFGILSRRRPQPKEIWHVHVAGSSAEKFLDEIGFNLERKQNKLKQYVQARKWFKKEHWEDEIIGIEESIADVYDITVDVTHRYVAHGFINHNSYWHSNMMTKHLLEPAEIVDYADHHSGTLMMQPGQLNPYKLGIELLKDIEERWNKGQFGKEYNECANMRERVQWNRKLGLGRQKIFEVRKLYNDVMFIDEFLTPEFCAKHKMFVYAYNVSADRYEIATREFEKIKRQLLFQLTNFGNPIIHVVDANHKNRGELLLKQAHEGVDLRLDWAKEALKALYRIWQRPAHIETIIDGVPKVLSFDGKEHHENRP